MILWYVVEVWVYNIFLDIVILICIFIRWIEIFKIFFCMFFCLLMLVFYNLLNFEMKIIMVVIYSS